MALLVAERSPFAGHYEVRTECVPDGFWEPVTPRQERVRHVLEVCGAAAALTLERLWSDPRKGRRQLAALARSGCLGRHRLLGDRPLNVYTLGPSFELEPGLRCLAAAHFYVRLREAVGCRMEPDGLWWVLEVGGRRYGVVVHRSRFEDPLVLVPFLKGPTVVVSDVPVRVFEGLPVRLVLDADLVGGSLRFRLPDGREDPSVPFLRQDTKFPRRGSPWLQP